MTRDSKRRYLEAISACAVCALAITPTFGQSTTGSGSSSPGTSQSTPSESRPGTGTDTLGRDTQRGQDTQMNGRDAQPSHSGRQGRATQVRRVQEALKAEGHDPGPIDGVMGSKTQEALRQYQRDANLPVTGRLDQPTMEKLGVEQVSSRR